jgi:hypothetical protein
MSALVQQSDPQDPLPESRWTWRRLFAWSTNLATLAGVAWIIHQLGDDPALVGIAYALLLLNAFGMALYIAGASADHIVRLVQEAKVRRAGAVERAAEMVARRDGEGDV